MAAEAMALALLLAVGLLLGAQASSDCDDARPHKGSKRRDVVRFLFVCFLAKLAAIAHWQL